MHDAAQAAGDGLEELAQIEGGDDRVIDFEQKRRAVALARELFLIGLGRLGN